MNGQLKSILSLVLIFVLSGCSGSGGVGTSVGDTSPREPSEELIGKALGVTNGMPIGFDEFDEVAARRGAMAKSLDEETRKDIVNGLIDEKLLYLEAVRKGADLFRANLSNRHRFAEPIRHQRLRRAQTLRAFTCRSSA